MTILSGVRWGRSWDGSYSDSEDTCNNSDCEQLPAGAGHTTEMVTEYLALELQLHLVTLAPVHLVPRHLATCNMRVMCCCDAGQALTWWGNSW